MLASCNSLGNFLKGFALMRCFIYGGKGIDREYFDEVEF